MRNIAVIIGIDAYAQGIPPLETAVGDANAVAQLLKTNHEYKPIWKLANSLATRDCLQHLLLDTLPNEVEADDCLFFYFAGHGIAFPGEEGPQGYLIPQDAKLGDITTYLPMSIVEKALSQLPCHHCLVILDCCFAGAFRWSMSRHIAAVPEVIHKERYDRFLADPAWQVLTSSAYDQTALDALKLSADRDRALINNYSPFATALLEALSGQADVYPPPANGQPGGDGIITATELYLYLRDHVETLTQKYHKRQTPGLWFLPKHDKGEYIFLTQNFNRDNLANAPSLDDQEKNNPYRGLRSYEKEHADLFFGRTGLIGQLCEFVNQHRLVVVLGASGSGKSSLVKAGLIPHLEDPDQLSHQQSLNRKIREHQHPDKTWCILPVLRPGEFPLSALHAACQTTFPKNLSFSEGLSTWSQQNPTTQLLITVDQLEELITQCRSEAEREEFLEELGNAIQTCPNLSLVFTLRSDFEPQFRKTPLEPYWQKARFIVPAMTREELREAIEEPASAKVVFFNPPELVEHLIDEVAQMPGALPLLSFTLSELYLKLAQRYLDAQNRGDIIERAITQADYDDLGGVTRSLTQRADQEYENLVKQDPAYAQTIRHVMLRMVAVGGELARRRVPFAELEYPEPENTRVQQVIERFEKARLLVKDRDQKGQAYVEPAHDELVRGWDKLLVWKKEDEENLMLQRRLIPAATEWNSIKNQNQEKSAETLSKATLVFRKLDQQLFNIENLLTEISKQFIKLFQQSQSPKEKFRPKVTQFLWNSNPYLDLLTHQLHSNNQWLNCVERQFVQESILQRKRNNHKSWRIVVGIILGLSGLTAYALVQTNIAVRNEQISLARQIVAQSQRLESEDPNLFELSALLAVESMKRFKELNVTSLEGDSALRKVMQKLPLPVWSTYLKRPLNQVQIFQTGKLITFLEERNQIAYIDGNDLISVDIETNKKIKLFSLESDYRKAAISSNLEYIAWQNANDIVKVFEIHSRRKVAEVQLSSQDRESDIFFSPNSKYIVIGNNIFRFSDVSLLERVSIPDIWQITFSPDSEFVAGYYDRYKTIWNIYSGNKILDVPYEAGTSFGQDFVLSQNGKYFATAGSFGTAEVWDSITQERILFLSEKQTGWVTAIAISSNGQYLALGDRSSNVSVWEIETGEKIVDFQVEAANDWISTVLFGPYDNYIAATANSITKIYSLISGRELYRITEKREYENIDLLFSKSGNYVFLAFVKMFTDADASPETKISLWHLDSHFVLDGWLEKSLTSCKNFVFTTANDKIRSTPISQGKLSASESLYMTEGHSVKCSNSGKTLLIESEDGFSLYKLLNKRWVFLKSYSLKNESLPNEASLTLERVHGFYINESKILMSLCDSNQFSSCQLVLFNTDTRRKENLIPVGHIVSSSPTGRYVVFSKTSSNEEKEYFQILDLVNLEVIDTFTLPSHLPFRDISFNHDQYVAIAGGFIGASGNNPSDGFLLVYDILSGEMIFETEIERAINGSLIHPSGRYVAASVVGGDYSSRIWEIDTGKEVIRLPNSNAFFDQSGQFIWTFTNNDGENNYGENQKSEISFHPFNVENLTELACHRLSRNLTIEEWNTYLGNQPYRKTCPNLE